MGNITGNVEDRNNGQPLERVLIRFPGTSTFTDSSGNYILTTFDPVSGPLEFSKDGYESQSVLIDAPFPEAPDFIRGASLIPVEEPPIPPPEEPEFPKTISRAPYSFSVNNAEEEKQVKEFLGIDPSGISLDDFLALRDLQGLEQWRDFWDKIFGLLGRVDIVTFLRAKFQEFKEKLLPPIPPPEEPPPEPLDPIERLKELIDNDLFDDIVDFLSQPLFTFETSGEEDGIIYFVVPVEFTPLAKLKNLGSAILSRVGFKGFLKSVGKTQLRQATPQQIEEMLKGANFNNVLEAWRKEPAAFARIAKGFSVEGQAMISSALRKQNPQTGLRFLNAALDEKAAAGLPLATKFKDTLRNNWGKGIFGIIGLGMAVFGTISIKDWAVVDDVGQATNIDTFQIMQEFEDGRLTKERAIEELEKNLAVIDFALNELERTHYINPFTFIYYDTYKLALEESKEDTERRLEGLRGIEVPTETSEEMWERINRENEERRQRLIQEEEARWKQTQKETDERRRLAKIEEQEYWDRVIEEAEIRRIERRKEEALFWENIKIRADEEREAKRIEADEFWTNVRAEQEKQREEEQARWDEILRGPPTGTLFINSDPILADVYIDGEYLFVQTPFTSFLSIGTHVIRVQKEGFIPEERTITVNEGDDLEILIPLTPETSEEILAQPYVPFQPILPPGFEPLFPAVQAPLFFDAPTPAAEKELLVNIETTDSKPWKGRIYSIAYQDLSIPGAAPVILINENEEELLREFLNIFNQLLPARLIGFKLTFDHRYIFNKLMLYRMQSSKWANIDLKDVKQLLDQVKEEFVYFPDKTGTLDDYGKSLLGKGKYGSQKTMLKMFLAKNFDYVKAFQERQIEITRDLYDLFRFSASGSSAAASLGTSHTNISPEMPSIPIPSMTTREKKCKNCIQVNSLNATECLNCGDKF